jgi:hypothetical protein
MRNDAVRLHGLPVRVIVPVPAAMIASGVDKTVGVVVVGVEIRRFRIYPRFPPSKD